MNPPRQFHFVFLCFYFPVLFNHHVPLATSVEFSFNFSNPGDPCDDGLLICEHDTRKGSDVIELTKNEISGNAYSTGRASYPRPVPLWNKAGEVASFVSNFTFQIKPKDEIAICKCTCNTSGDGMAFFLARYPSRIPPNSYGANLALFNDSNNLYATGDSRVVAVEFDTFLNLLLDQSSNHVGIDVNTIISKAYTNVTKGLVSEDAIMAATISYNNLTGFLAVHLQIGDGKPYNVSATVDMRATLPEEVAVGFSAATGACAELHQLLSWSFSSTLQPATNSTKPKSSRRLLPVLVPVAVAVFVVFLCVLGFLLPPRRRIWRRLTGRTDDDIDSDEEREQAEFERGVGPRRYRYREIAAATRNFAGEEKLGQGGFGNVYRGVLGDHDRPVAVKMFSAESSAQGRKAFEAEVKIISRLRHRNLVQLLGWCDSRKGLLLVYELVPEGSLDKHLYGSLLSWPDR